MVNKTLRTMLGVALCAALPAMPVWAADLDITVDLARHTVTVTNNMVDKVNLHYVKGPDGLNRSLTMQVDGGATVEGPLHQALPLESSEAGGQVNGENRELTVDLVTVGEPGSF